MSDLLPSAGASGTPSGRLRILVIVMVGLCALNVVQYSARAMDERTWAAEHEKDAARLSAALSPRATVDRFHRLFYENPGALGQNRWLGIRADQNPMDVWITQEIIHEVKPDFVVEAGTAMGGSAVLWAMIAREENPRARVITIDILDRTADARKLPIFKERVDFLLGSSTAPEIVAEVKRRVDGHKVVVLLDSDHHKGHVLNELRAYADIIQPGGYLIVQDSNINGHPIFLDQGYLAADYSGQPGPWEAVMEFVKTDDRFKIDLSRERLMLTMNPHGFLKRVK
jgi:cephalosporin hydroxylase